MINSSTPFENLLRKYIILLSWTIWHVWLHLSRWCQACILPLAGLLKSIANVPYNKSLLKHKVTSSVKRSAVADMYKSYRISLGCSGQAIAFYSVGSRAAIQFLSVNPYLKPPKES